MKQTLSTTLIALAISTLMLIAYHYSGLGIRIVEVQPPTSNGDSAFAMQVGEHAMPSFNPVDGDRKTALADFNYAAEKAMPAVVHIKSFQTFSRNTFDAFYYDLFGIRPRKHNNNQHVSSGSGVIISPDGYIVTNNHVIKDADELNVTLFDNRTYKATVIGTDPSTDLGLIKIDEKNLPTLVLANSDNARVGQWVLAVGNPFSLASTATAGIVSAIGRDLEIIEDRMAIESFIQTDAAVNPGNSGGALVDLKGLLLGVNTAIASPTGAYAGYAFAVPANIVKKVVSDLKKYGTVQRAFLGVGKVRSLDGDLARSKNIKFTEGILIEDVPEFGGAYKAGIQPGDIIVSIDGIKIKSEARMLELVGRNKPGDIIDVKVYSNGKYLTHKVTLTNEYGETEIVAPERNETLNQLGLEIRDLTTRERNRLNIERGVVVTKLYAGIIRQKTDIRQDFIILKINGKPIETAKELIKVLETSEGTISLTGFYPRYNRLFTYEFEK